MKRSKKPKGLNSGLAVRAMDEASLPRTPAAVMEALYDMYNTKVEGKSGRMVRMLNKKMVRKLFNSWQKQTALKAGVK